jgi:hypothetical protein
MQIPYYEDWFYKVYYQTKTDQYGLKENQSYSKLARPKKYYRVKIIFRILQLLPQIHCKMVRKNKIVH